MKNADWTKTKKKTHLQYPQRDFWLRMLILQQTPLALESTPANEKISGVCSHWTGEALKKLMSKEIPKINKNILETKYKNLDLAFKLVLE